MFYQTVSMIELELDAVSSQFVIFTLSFLKVLACVIFLNLHCNTNHD